VIRGAITSDERFARLADSASAQVLDNTFPSDERGSEEIWQDYLRMFSDAVRRHRDKSATSREALEKYAGPITIDDLDDTDVLPFLRETNPRASVTIGDAVIHVGDQRVEVGAIRVAVASIAAWWPLAAEAGVNITFSRVEPSSDA
jgi:hypothetical protein